VKQLMTWGTLSATPRVLSRPENEDVIEPKTPFHIQDMSSRELLSRKLANTASKSLKAKAEMMRLRTPGISRGERTKGDMGPPSWTPRRAEAAGNLTPAARRLLERSTLGAAAAKRGEGATAQERDLNRVRWTPTPASRRVG
jgi:protein DGCR14